MNKKLCGIIGVGMIMILLLAVGCTKPEVPAKPAVPEPTPIDEVASATEDTTSESATGMGKVVVEMTSSGFSPKVVMVKAGQEVVFLNKDTVDHQPASGPHPIHTGYPDSAASKCGTAAQTETFDSCTPVAPNDKYTFIFTHKGEWQFHDHLNPGMTGTMVVN